MKTACFVDNSYTYGVFWKKESARENDNVCGYKIMSIALFEQCAVFDCTLPCKVSNKNYVKYVDYQNLASHQLFTGWVKLCRMLCPLISAHFFVSADIMPSTTNTVFIHPIPQCTPVITCIKNIFTIVINEILFQKEYYIGIRKCLIWEMWLQF